MGLVEDLVEKVQDEYLRGELQTAVAALKQSKRFGRVFEDHLPETSTLPEYPVRVGTLVELRRGPPGGRRHQDEVRRARVRPFKTHAHLRQLLYDA
jgi:hypothetical protein